MHDTESYQQELKSRLELGQKLIEDKIPLLVRLWDLWLKGFFNDNEESILSMILHLSLFVSQNNLEGKTLFINILEHTKIKYPELAAEFWYAYDDWDNIHNTDFYKFND